VSDTEVALVSDTEVKLVSDTEVKLVTDTVIILQYNYFALFIYAMIFEGIHHQSQSFNNISPNNISHTK